MLRAAAGLRIRGQRRGRRAGARPELLACSHGVDAARRASIACCQQTTDLTRDAIAAVHGIERVEPSDKHATTRTSRQGFN